MTTKTEHNNDMWIIIIGLLLVSALIILVAVSSLMSIIGGVQFIGTPQKIYPQILKLAKLSSGENFVELGSGSGSLLRYVADNSSARAKGIEISPLLVLYTKLVHSRRADITVTLKNFKNVDLSDANCIYCYLLPKLMQKLAIKFREELRPGTAVISYAFPIPGKQPVRVIPKANKFSALYLYRY